MVYLIQTHKYTAQKHCKWLCYLHCHCLSHLIMLVFIVCCCCCISWYEYIFLLLLVCALISLFVCVFQICGCGQGSRSAVSLFPLLSLSGGSQTQQQSMTLLSTLCLFNPGWLVLPCVFFFNALLLLFLVPWDGSIRHQTRQGQWHDFPQLQVSDTFTSLLTLSPVRKHVCFLCQEARAKYMLPRCFSFLF